VDLGSYSSRVTYMAGNAALQAANTLQRKLLQAAADELDVNPSQLELRDGQLWQGEHCHSWTDLIAWAEAREGTLGATGSYRPPRDGERGNRQRVGPSPAYSFTAQVAEVNVDLETGVVSVEQIWCAHDLGRVLHHDIAEGQVEGCVYMGVGEALTEEQTYENGVIRTPSILEYRIPTIHETPPIHTTLVESVDPGGPFGAKEVGEGPQLSTVPAIANAIHDATGCWLTNPPFTPDKVLRALRARARSSDQEQP
jgi:CO/xanthine dehydrogenase Mo-binding subunit